MENVDFTIHPFVHQLTGESAVMVFELEENAKVLLRLKGEGDRERLIPPPSRHGLVDGSRRLFRIPLVGLKPGRRYSCTLQITPILSHETTSFVFAKEREVLAGSFRTLGDRGEGQRFILLQDLHGNWPLLKRISETAEGEPDVLLFNGDLLRHAVNKAEITEFIREGLEKSRWRDLPFHFIRGNHECRGRDAHMLQRYFPGREDRFYYSFSAGGSFFLVLDTGEDKEDEHEEYGGLADFDAYRLEQLDWLRRQLDSAEAREADFRVVVMHVPPYSEEDWHVNRHLQEYWVPAFNDGGVDLVLSGHDHIRGRRLQEEWENGFSLLIGDTECYMDLELSIGRLDVMLKDEESKILEDSRITLDSC